jgi:hypothetical protein
MEGGIIDMSNNVDEKVVRMLFDNQQFEKGVQTTMKSLDNLKKGLDLEKSTKSLSGFQNVAKNFSLDAIASAANSITNRFSAMGVAGMAAIQNIVNTAMNAGKRMLSALTIDPVKTGLNEYETQMTSIQTILSNTRSDGTTINDVNKS